MTESECKNHFLKHTILSQIFTFESLKNLSPVDKYQLYFICGYFNKNILLKLLTIFSNRYLLVATDLFPLQYTF